MKKKHIFFAFFLFGHIYYANSQDIATAIRIDFFRCGNAKSDSIRVKDIFLQNNNTISLNKYIDEVDYGVFRIEAFDKNMKRLFCRGYNSLFNEWKTTKFAQYQTNCFEESVLIPYNKDISEIVFSARDSLNIWHIEKAVSLSVFSLKSKKIKKYKVKELSEYNSPYNNLDILFLPDGYTKKEMKIFEKDCQNAMTWILEAEPFNEFADKIAFRAVLAPSKESGTDYPHKGILKNTLLNSSFNTFESERYLTTLSYHKVIDVASNALADHIIILVNSNDYGGGGFYNFFTLSSVRHKFSNFLVQHELGHGLCGLADEYYDSEVAYSDMYNFGVEPWEPNITTLVDFSKKWDTLLSKYTPIPTPANNDFCDKIGVFEGAGYSAKGIYQPACECTMKSVRYNFFCEACKASVRRIIKWYAL